MFYWMKPLPEVMVDDTEYKPFIENDWFRQHFMWFVYILQGMLIVFSILWGAWNLTNVWIEMVIFAMVYVVHELLHISVVWRIGDISLTHRGIFCWLHSSAKMTKTRFLSFMAIPLLILTVVPVMIATLFAEGLMEQFLWYIAWVNSIIAGADIINTFLILIKPRSAIFYRGYYKVG